MLFFREIIIHFRVKKTARNFFLLFSAGGAREYAEQEEFYVVFLWHIVTLYILNSIDVRSYRLKKYVALTMKHCLRNFIFHIN